MLDPETVNVQHVIEKAMCDADFRKELIDNPAKVLEKNGIMFLKQFEVHIYENTKNILHFVVSTKKVPESVIKKGISKNSSLEQVTLWIDYQFQNNTHYKDELLADPAEVFAEFDMDLGKDKKYIVHENTDKVKHFVLPRMLESGDELHEYELENVGGGKTQLSQLGGKSDGASIMKNTSEHTQPYAETLDPHSAPIVPTDEMGPETVNF